MITARRLLAIVGTVIAAGVLLFGWHFADLTLIEMLALGVTLIGIAIAL